MTKRKNKLFARIQYKDLIVNQTNTTNDIELS